MTTVAGRHVWEETVPAWHAVFLVAAVVAAALATVGGGGAPSLVVLGVAVAWYGLTGASALGRAGHSGLGAVYVAGAVALVLGLFAVDSVAGGVLLFVVFPQVWRMLPTRGAVAATVALSTGIAVVIALKTARDDPGDLPAVLGWMAGTLAVALLVGLWITRITDQSRRRAELLTELEATRAELAAAERDLGALAERERLAREIHDTLAQGFTSIVLLAQGLDPADPVTGRILATARENLAESRALVAALAPTQLGDATLPAALRRLVERMGVELGVEATMCVEGAEHPLTAAQDVVLLRVSQEALANVRRHAGANRVELVLGYAGDGVALLVRDDGRGFDVAGARPGSFGLSGMRDRVREVGGTLDVRSGPGAGTCVEVRL